MNVLLFATLFTIAVINRHKALIAQPLAIPLTFTPAWLGFAHWATGLLG
jgi:hypothetical protein